MSDKLVLTVKVKGVVLTSEPIHQGQMNTLFRGLQRVDSETAIVMAVPVDLLGIEVEEPKDGPGDENDLVDSMDPVEW